MSMADDRERFVWNTFKGNLDTASIADTRNDKWSIAARLQEPYGSRVEWFNFDDLERRGRVEKRGYVVLSPEQWVIERDALFEKFQKFQKDQARVPPLNPRKCNSEKY